MAWVPKGDDDAIHDNVAGEINAITEKVSPVSADLVLIEDSAASYAKKKVQIGNLPGGGSGAPTSSEYVTTAADGSLSNEVVIPGLAGSADIAGAAGGGADEEYDSGTSPFTWTSAPSAEDVNTTRPSHLHIEHASTTEIWGTKAWAPAGAFDARAHLSTGGRVTGGSGLNWGLFITDSTDANRLLMQTQLSPNSVDSRLVQAYTYASGSYTSRGSNGSVPNDVYVRITRDGSGNVTFWWSSDGRNYLAIAHLAFSITVAEIGYRIGNNGTINQAIFESDWLRTDV